MTDYPYQPPEREFESVITAYRDFVIAGAWSVRVEPDPLGDVNKIVRLMRGGKQVKSVLARVPAGATVRLVRDEGGYRMEDLFALRDAQWRTEYGRKVATVHVAVRQPGWRVEIDGETVLAVTDAELRPPYVPPPPPPLWRRMRQALREQVRADVDAVAGRRGFHRVDECRGWDE